MEFSRMLKKRRTELNMTQQALADKLFVTRQTVSRWENNLSYPNLDLLVAISDILDISLDEFLKGEGIKMVNQISHDVRSKNKYKRYFIGALTILLGLLLLNIILGYSRYNQKELIDRINPFLTTRYGYGVLPNKSSRKIDTYISDDPLGNGEWLKFEVGQYTPTNKWVLVEHKGSYVSGVRMLESDQIPVNFQEQVGKDYFKYDQKAMGPRVSKKWNWLPWG